MRVLKKSLISACLALALVLMLPSLDVYAEENNGETTESTTQGTANKSYTVTIRPGNVGKIVKNMKKTTHGAIKISVTEGDGLPELTEADFQADPGYFVKNIDDWYKIDTLSGTIDRDMDFVVDYGRLVNGVDYTIKYVDSASKENISAPIVKQANVGDARKVNAPTWYSTDNGDVYKLVSASSITLTLDADATKNIFTFEYTYAPAGTVIEEVIIGEDGEIITTTDYVTTTINNGTTVAPGGVAAGGAGGAGGAADGGAAEGGEAAGAGGAVEIPDEETPLAGGIGEATEEGAGMVEIGEEEVPLAAGEEPMANMALIGASIFGAGAVMLAVLWLFMKKKRVTAETTTKEE